MSQEAHAKEGIIQMPKSKIQKMPHYSFWSLLDFAIEVCEEKIADNGEDSFLYVCNDFGSIAGVFDGCGGSGAKKYERYKGKTGAYMAARVVAGAVKDWFLDLCKNGDIEGNEDQLKNKIIEYLTLCKQIGGGATVFKGSLFKEFPTTAAAVVSTAEKGKVKARCIWAGDSRCYVLDPDGLKQLTEDDLGGLDAMENLTADGALTNVITMSKDFDIHTKTIELSKPSVLFAATDGCFGYFSTPMEFEYLLLSTLMEANTAEEWEAGISNVLHEIAGDDYTISGMSLGFGNFANMKISFGNRLRELYEAYIVNIREKSKEEKIAMWRTYRVKYSQYLSEG